MGGRTHVGLARAEERVGEVDADGGRGGAGADVDGSSWMMGGSWSAVVLALHDAV